MVEFFKAGGPAMFVTLAFGFLLVGAAVLFAVRKDRGLLPLVGSLGLGTLFSGALGCTTGLIATFRFLEQVPADEQLQVAALGAQESLHNLVLALLLLTLAAIVASVGSFRSLPAPSPSLVA